MGAGDATGALKFRLAAGPVGGARSAAGPRGGDLVAAAVAAEGVGVASRGPDRGASLAVVDGGCAAAWWLGVASRDLAKGPGERALTGLGRGDDLPDTD